MGAYICAISFRDWLLARSKGIYGNKSGNLREQVYAAFNPNIKNSIVRDLAGMQPGDQVFFHVVKHRDVNPRALMNSSIHGVYIVRERPFYDRTRVWTEDEERFPYRFLFEPDPNHPMLAEYDAYISIEDFYNLIERREIWSLATLENEKNLEARSVRRIEGEHEAENLIRTLYRDFPLHRQTTKIRYTPAKAKLRPKSIESEITNLGSNENALKAVILHKLGIRSPDLVTLFGPIDDFMNEVFIAQTTRKAIDILAFGGQPEGGRRYVICEVKAQAGDPRSLKQLLYYMDLFRLKPLFDRTNDKIVGCLLAKRFPPRVMDFCGKLNMQGVGPEILLVRYYKNDAGDDATFERVV